MPPMLLATFIVSVLAGRMSERLNPHLMGLVGLVLLASGFGLLCLSIDHEFKTQMVDTFKTTWGIATLFAVAGFFSAFFTYVACRPG